MAVICRRTTLGYCQPGLANSLGLFVALMALTLAPVETWASKQKVVRKDTAKNKSATAVAPVQKLSKSQTRNALLRQPTAPAIDLSERREQSIHRVRSGETLTEVLARYRIAPADRLLWTRTLKRNSGSEV